MVTNVADNLGLAFYSKNGLYYKSSYVWVLMRHTFAVWIRGDVSVMDAVEKAWDHWGSVLSMLNPRKWMKFCQQLMDDSEYCDLLFAMNGSISDALGRMTKEERIRWWPFVSKHIKETREDRLFTLGDTIWELCGQLLPPEEARSLIHRFGDNEKLVKAMVTLCAQKRGLFGTVVAGKGLPIVLQFVKLFKEDIGFGQVFARVAGICGKLDDKENDIALDIVLATMNHREELGDEEIEELEPILETIEGLLTGQQIEPNKKAKLVEILRLAVSKKIIERDLSCYIDLESPVDAVVAPSIRIIADFEQMLSDEKVQEHIGKLAFCHKGETYKNILELLSNRFAQMKAVNEEWTFRVAKRCLHPLPSCEYAKPIVKFLLSLQECELFDRRLDLDLHRVFFAYYAIEDEELVPILSELVRRTRLEIDWTKADILGACGMLFRYKDEIERDFLLEFLDYQMVPPEALRYAVDLIKRCRSGAHFYYSSLVSLLEQELIELRFDVAEKINALPKIDHRVREEDHKWITAWDLHKLFGQIQGNFYESEFALLLKSTLEALLSLFDYDSSDNSTYALLAVLVGLTMNIFPTESSQILLRIIDANNKKGNSELLKRAIKVAKGCIIRHKIPLSGAIAITNFALATRDFKKAWRLYERYILLAIEQDRGLAARVADEVNQPLPPMKTFLSFVKAKQHKEWVDICQHSFPPEEWILLPSDAELIRELPNTPGSADIQERVLARIQRLKAAHTEETFNPPPVTFEFREPSVCEIEYKIHPTEPATLENLISYLWHDGRDLPADLTPEKLEEIAINNPSNMRLLAVFFGWAKKHEFKIDTAAWAKRFCFESFGADTVIAISNFLLHVQCPFAEISSDVRSLIQIGLQILGRDEFSDDVIANMFLCSTGLEWIFAKAIILIDTEHWDAYPAIRPILVRNLRLLREFLVRRDQPKSFFIDLYHIMSELCFIPDNWRSTMRLVDMIPTAYECYPKMLRFFTEEERPEPIPLQQKTLECLLSALEFYDTPPPSYWNLFFSLVLTDEQIARVKKIMKLTAASRYSQWYYLPGNFDFRGRLSITAFTGGLDSDVEAYYCHKPPSFTRCYIRATQTPFSKRMPENFEKMIKINFANVHPALMYTGQASFGIPVWPNSLASSLLRYGLFSGNIGRELVDSLDKHSCESIANAIALLRLPDEHLSGLLSHCIGTTGRDAIIQTLVNSMVTEGTSLLYAIGCVRALASIVKPESLVVLICSREFLTKGNFACAFSVFHIFEGIIKATAPELMDFVSVFHMPDSGIFEDAVKSRALCEAVNAETAASILHET